MRISPALQKLTLKTTNQKTFKEETMNEQVKKISILTVAIAVGLAITVSSSFACWGNGMGLMANSTHALTVEQLSLIHI